MIEIAQPIWPAGQAREMNVHAVFRAHVDLDGPAELRVTAASFYRVWVDGTFLAFGPARAAEGYARVDVLPLVGHGAGCEVIIEVVGYGCGSLATVRQPAFLLAEIVAGGTILAATGRDVEAYLPGRKVQQAERYSIQRHFCEVWDFAAAPSLIEQSRRAELEIMTDVPDLLPRVAPPPAYDEVDLARAALAGTLAFDATLPYDTEHYSWRPVPPEWGCFDWDDIDHHARTWVQRHRQTRRSRDVALPVELAEGEFVIMDFGRIEAGFLRAGIDALADTELIMAFSEDGDGETFTFPQLDAHNTVTALFPAGDSRDVLSFEPYTFRYVLVAVKSGAVRLRSFGMTGYTYPLGDVTPPAGLSPVLEQVYGAGARSFAHNAVDLYLDCPSRERAGWLCDSYFTAKTEYALTGATRVEDAFLDNYLRYEQHGEYPDGVLPMCYPSDRTPDVQFIPQWTMWFVLEVEDYVLHRGHADRVEDFRASVYGLLDFYRRYENADGLLERLPSWNFVEWSKANEWTWDVNYPTNFLYAQVLQCVAELYGDEACRQRAEQVRRVAIAQSFNGTWFVDHAVRDDEGVLQVRPEASEAGQYYAVLFGGVDLDTAPYAALKQLIFDVFSPDRPADVMPQIMAVNAFVGAYLRLELLRRRAEHDLVLDEVERFFGPMVSATDTLWENRDRGGSLDHGFASYALVLIQQAQAGRAAR